MNAHNSSNPHVHRIALTLFAAFFLPSVLLAQVAPHHRVLDMIKSGEIEKPAILKDIASLRARGIDAPWKSPSLVLQRSSAAGVVRKVGAASTPTGTFRTLAILVSFSDKAAKTDSTKYDSLLFGANYGSLRNYYKVVSYGSLDVVSINLPSSLGWKTMSNKYSYYVNNSYGLGSYPYNAQKLVEDAVNAVNGVVDFSKYDNDGDGYVDALFIIHAGQGAEYTGKTTDIWSHSWATYSPITVDGVKVYRYSMEPEYWSASGDMTMGVFAHEFAHNAFGLPDLYDTDYSSNGVGSWSLMGSGNWNGANSMGESPAFPDAWSRMQMGYVTPTNITANVTGQTINAAESKAEAYSIWRGGVPDSEYFLVENRQQTSYDTYLPGSGLLIYHVDDSIATDNEYEWYPGHTDSSHYLVAVEQADGLYDLEKYANRGDAGDPFPGSTSNTVFSGTTTPDSKDYSGTQTGVRISSISASAAAMTADFALSSYDTAIVVTSPNGGESWTAGSTQTIAWESYYLSGNVLLQYSTDKGSSWTTIATTPLSTSSVPSSSSAASTADAANGSTAASLASAVAGSYAWTVPNTSSTTCLVRVQSVSRPSMADTSNGTFYVIPYVAGRWDLQYAYNAYSVTGANGNAGALFIPTLREFWTSRWSSSTTLHRWTPNGKLIGSFTVTGVSSVRGMTFDGTYVYAVSNSTTVSRINPTTRTRTSTFTVPTAARYITYDPTANSGAGGFWIGNYQTNVYLVNSSGTKVDSLKYANLGITNIYGAAVDTISSGGPYLWIFGQGSGYTYPQRIVQVKISTGLPTGVEHDVTTDVGSGQDSTLAGGLFVARGLVPGTATVGGLLQGAPDYLFGYQVATLAPSTGKWAETITVTDNCGDSTKLAYGLWPNATSGLDTTFLEARITTAVPAGTFDTRFVLPSSTTTSRRDYRDSSTAVATWNLRFQGCSYPMIFSWDKTAFPTGGFTLQDTLGGSKVSMDMKSLALCTVSDTTVKSLQILFDESALPITLVSFTAVMDTNSRVQLKWTTASEVDNFGFYVQRSASATTGFEDIQGSFQASAGDGTGTSTEPHTYSFVDASPVAGMVYYRLKQVELTGAVNYFEPVRMTATGITTSAVPVAFQLKQNYPNPFNPTTTISYSIPASGRVRMVVYDVIGSRVVTLVDGVVQAGQYTTSFDAGRYAAGTYFCRLESAGKVAVIKMLLLK